MHKNLENFFKIGILKITKITDEKSRIRIRIRIS